MGIDDLTGRNLGPYQLQTLLGKGGMGSVYRAFQPNLKRMVAVKVLLSKLATDPDFEARFQQEAQIAASLQHPNIVPIFDYGTHDTISYIVMPYLTGGSLQTHLETGARFSLAQLADMVAALANALDYGHQQGVIHRDIKPANIMFDTHGNPLIVDFGIAQLLHETAPDLPQPGGLSGTPLFMAPEQWRGDAVSPATDQYALAVMTYLMLVGHYPFQIDEKNAVIYAHLMQEPTPPQDHNPAVPTHISQAVLKALAKAPQQRFATVSAFAAALNMRLGTEESGASGLLTTHLEYLDDTPTFRHGADLKAVLVRAATDVPDLPDTSLVGRDGLLDQIKTLLDDDRRVLLQGSGGMGKTALAATAMAQFVAERDQPALWLRVGSTAADGLFEALARPFDRQKEIALHSGAALINLVRDILAASQVGLLVLDDAWDGPALQTILKAVPTDMRVIVTARHRYPPPLHRLRVSRLERRAALDLLAEHSGLVYEDDEADQLCADLGDSPFALRVAGKTLAVDEITPAELRRRIQAAPHSLAMPEDFAEEGRSSITQLLDASLAALPHEARAVFLVLGAFFDPHCTADMVRDYITIGNGDPPDSDKALTLLVRRGLLERIAATDDAVAHYRLHDLAYSYAKAQNTDAERHRALDASLTYLEQYHKPQSTNFAALRPLIEHLLAAQVFAVEVERWADVEQFACHLVGDVGFVGFLQLRGLYHQALVVLERAIEAGQQLDNPAIEKKHLAGLGIVYQSMGDFVTAGDTYEQALAIAQQIGDRQSEGVQTNNLGNVYVRLGQREKAIEYYTHALAIARETGNRRGEVMALGNLANVHSTSDPETAIGYFQDVLVITRELGNRRSEGRQLGNLGNAYGALKDYETAIDYHEQALAIAREVGDRPAEGRHLTNLGRMHTEQGQHTQALDYLRQGLAIDREVGDKYEQAVSLGNLAITYQGLRQYDDALDHFEQARAIFTALGAVQYVKYSDELIAKLEAEREGGDDDR